MDIDEKQKEILKIIDKAKEITAYDVSKENSLDHTVVHHRVKLLQAMKLLKSEGRVDNNRYKIYYSITEKGREALKT
jgi:DNA-binding MarR family transcriptional regulator